MYLENKLIAQLVQRIGSLFAGILKQMRRPPMRAILASVLLQVLWVLPTLGQQPVEPEQPEPDLTKLSLNELTKVHIETVYGASKFEQKVTRAPSSVTIVTADEIQKYGYHTLADLVKSVPGFYINYDRQDAYIGVRGVSRPSDYNSLLLTLVDGHRVNDNVYDGTYIDGEFTLDFDLIDRVEIIRGLT